MKKRKLMTVIHIAISAAALGGMLALCGCSSGSNFGSALGGGSAGSNGCVAACGGCIGGAASTFALGFCTGCGEGCVGFF